MPTLTRSSTAPVVQREVWHIHVYRNGRYSRTIDEALPSKKMADSFVQTFNMLNLPDKCEAIAERAVSVSRPRAVV